MITKADCKKLDVKDPFKSLRRKYYLPPGVIYLDGNSLGPLPKAVKAKVAKAVKTEWGRDLITSWNKNGWFHLPRVTGDKIARLIGAGAGNVIVADTISINLFKLLSAALSLRPDRKVVLSDTGNFPSDLYVAQGLNTFMRDGHSLKLVEPQQVLASIDQNVAVVMITDVDYRSCRRHDMHAITKRAHDAGALVVWDLSHSAGAVPVDLLGADADFAVGCTYKYLNGGPGAPAFLFVNPRLQKQAMPALVGWWGQKAPFEFGQEFEPADGVVRFQAGTQAILSLRALDTAMDDWAKIDMTKLHEKSKSLCQLFIDLVEAQCGEFGLKLAGPRDFNQRGSHVSFHCPNGYAVMQAMIAKKVIGDFRSPDLIRFGFAPMYNTHAEVWQAAKQLHAVLTQKLWDHPMFLAKKAVT